MSVIVPLVPKQLVPKLEVPLVGGEQWSLEDEKAETFTMLVFYRGQHCPVCAKYLAQLENKVEEFQKVGVSTIAISSDTEERATASQKAWRLRNLRVGYGLDLDVARNWGLYLSAGNGKTSVGIEEPPLFSEPGVFLVRPDRTLYFATVQTMPFARPDFSDILNAVKFVIDKDYPARGEVLDHRQGQMDL